MNESEKKDSPSRVSSALPKAEEIGEERQSMEYQLGFEGKDELRLASIVSTVFTLWFTLLS